MKILTYSTLFPNSSFPRHGIFVEQRLRHLLASGEVESRVVAPVPWFPFNHSLFGEYAKYATVSPSETRHDIVVQHPRYPLLPKIGMNIAPLLLARASIKSVERLIKSGFDFDVLDAHYFYPDGVAAAMIAGQLNKPLVITARGTDINLIPQYAIPRKQILWAARQASAIITVCKALKDELVNLGADGEKIEVLRNGVDLKQFTPLARDKIRQQLGLQRTTLISVGHLIQRKGHDKVIQALTRLPEMDLLLVGDGEEESALRRLCRELNVQDRVRFVGHVDQQRLSDYYSAADALVLASSREGWPNVLLEAMACGTPVIATPIWGSPEVVRKPEAGRLASENSVPALVAAIKDLFSDYPDRRLTRQYAELHSWENTTQGQLAIFRKVARD